MRKISSILLIILLITNLSISYSESFLIKNSEETIENTFTDLENHWAKDQIITLYNLGGIKGYPDGSFRPEEKISIAEFLVMAAQSVTRDEIPSAKVGEHWARPYFNWAYSQGIVEISDLDESTWDTDISRYDMAKIIVKFLENIIGEEATEVAGVEEIMSDYEIVNKNPKAYYVKQAFAKGIINGVNEEGLFDGSKTGTRAEASTLILRLIDPERRKSVTLDGTSEEVIIPENKLTQDFIETFIESAIKETNNQRALVDAQPLERDDLLVEIAQYKSDDMVMLAKAGEPQDVYFSHESPTYGDLRDLADLFNLSRYKSIGENLAWMPYAPADASPEALGQQAVLLLKTSTDHYEAMINEEYSEIGIGVSYRYYEEYKSGYLFVTQSFSN